MSESKRTLLSTTAAIFSAATLFASASYGESFKFKLRSVPPIPGTNCDDFAYAEGQRLRDSVGTSVPGFSLTDARCIQRDGNYGELPSWNIMITYESLEKLQSVSTVEDYALARPGTTTRQACETKLKDQIAIFTQQTGVAIFSAYCQVPMFENMLWETAIIGLGASEVRPFNASVTITGSIVGQTIETFSSMLRNEFKKLNAELAEVSTEGRLSSFMLATTYYSKERIRFQEFDLATFTTKENCLKEVAAATIALTEANVVTLGQYCHASVSDEIQISVLVESRSKLNMSASDSIYESFDDCEAQKDKTVAHYRTALHRDIKLGLCSAIRGSDASYINKFRVVMIEKR